MTTDLRTQIEVALQSFADAPLRSASINLLKTLGYQSEKTLDITSRESLQEHLDPNGYLSEENASLSKWSDVQFLFQLTSSEIATASGGQMNLIDNTEYDPKEINSYLFFALELSDEKSTKTQLSQITRSLNRIVPMPVFVIFKHDNSLSLAIINRRRNMRDGTRDVLTRVSLVRDISIDHPHRAHLDILYRFSLHSLIAETGVITTFADLDSAWQKTLSTQELNERFYKDLVIWFQWAVSEINLPYLPDYVEETPENREMATYEFTVRLICRLIFSWFLKEKKLIADELLEIFDASDQCQVPVKDRDDPDMFERNSYYRGVLQNIFFKALNKPMNKRRKSATAARNDKTVDDPEIKKYDYLGKNNLPKDFDYDFFDSIPYLNGGLFDVLPEDNARDSIEDEVIDIPNKLFAAKPEDGFTIETRNGRRRREKKVEGINHLFSRYRFTVTENTALEEDVALDPELLGMVFENLLAEINPTDKAAAKSARRASGSYYTPRRIVEYMVNETVHLHLRTHLQGNSASKRDLQLVNHLCYREEGIDFTPIAERVVEALDELRVLDPACGSGAFPMGMLHRIVELLRIVDPGNELWKRRMLSRIPEELREDAEEGMAGKSYDYLRKLGLIQKNLYGVDIQPLAVLIAKLRFFLTLVIEQEVDPDDRPHNYHLHALPNIETNLLCCNTLNQAKIDLFGDKAMKAYIKARKEYYNPDLSIEEREELSKQIAEILHELFPSFSREALGLSRPTDKETAREQNIGNLQKWFRTATIPAPFFSARAFFPEIGNAGFHIVIGNPPYGGDKIPNSLKKDLGLGSKDPYGAFIGRFLNDESDGRPATPLTEDGVLAYIVSDTFMTIKSHRPLRKQLLQHQIHKMLRVHPDTFHATVNTAVILCQRGSASENHTCQMADLTNVSIHEQFERFLHLLYQTEGFARRQNVSNQTYAIYHYKQSLIHTNSALPLFVASPKLFALMNDQTAPVTHETIGGKQVPVRTENLNGRDIIVSLLGDTGRASNGLSIGSTNRGLIKKNPEGHSGGGIAYQPVDLSLVITPDESMSLPDPEKRDGVTSHGVRVFVPYDKGADLIEEGDKVVLPNYYAPIQFYVDWSPRAVRAIRSNRNARVQGSQHYFTDALTYSFLGVYSPTFRLGNGGVFDVGGSPVNSFLYDTKQTLLAVLASKFLRFAFRGYLNHSINLQVEDVNSAPLAVLSGDIQETLCDLVKAIVQHQQEEPRYDYASNEQIEIDRLVYEAYGLNDDDIQEVENWYARRYPKLAKAQRKRLAEKEGKSEEELIERKKFHLYCDESRHLPYDGESCFLLGSLGCPAEKVKAAHLELSDLWKAHGLPPHFESKWTKVSPGKLDFYKALVDWFFDTEDISFRTRILPDKGKLYASLPEESRDHLYYRLYYQLLRGAIEPENRYRVFMDLKDTRGRQKRKELEQILHRDANDIDGRVIENLQHVHSHHVRLLQVCDLLLGAVGFARREEHKQESKAKRSIVEQIEDKLGQSLEMDTPPDTEKMTILTWHDKEGILL